MSEQKDKNLYRPFSRQIKSANRREINQSVQIKNSFQGLEAKQETISKNFVSKSQTYIQDKSPYSLANSAQEILKKLISCPKAQFQNLLKDRFIRQELKKEQKRIIKIRTDNKLEEPIDTELSIITINNLMTLAEQYINDINKEKYVQKSILRVNQQKDIAKQIKTIDQQIENNNFTGVKTSIQGLMKKYGKDDLLQEKIAYLNYILTLSQEYQKQANLFKDFSLCMEKFSSIETSPEGLTQGGFVLRNLKKQTTTTLNKENKKQQPNDRIITMCTQIDKIGVLLLGYIDSKTQKKGLQLKPKRQLQLEKQLQQKSKQSQFLQEYFRFCKDLLQKTASSKEQMFKQLQTLRKNKKKSTEVPYSFILKIYDMILLQKRQLNDVNIYLKSCSQVYIRKNLSNDNLLLQIKKLDERYTQNQILTSIKLNLDLYTNNVLERERSLKESTTLDLELRRLKLEIQRLEKLFEEQRNRAKEALSPSKNDKRRELQQRQEKEIEQTLQIIYANLSEKRWKAAKNAINAFLTKYEESSTSSFVVKIIFQSLSTHLSIIQEIQTIQSQIVIDKKQKTLMNYQKEKEVLICKSKSLEEYERVVIGLLQNCYEENFDFEAYFSEIRKDKKKYQQQRYQLISQLQEPLLAWKTRKQQPELIESNTLALSLSEQLESSHNELERIKKQQDQMKRNFQREREKNIQLQSRLKESTTKSNEIKKELEEFTNLSKKIQKGGEWWKSLPKNVKNSSFKQIYSILEKYRENELAIQRYTVNEDLLKQEAEAVNNAIDSCIVLIIGTENWLSEEAWEKKLVNFKGISSCDRLLTCLKQLTRKASMKIEEERKNYSSTISGYQVEIMHLTSIINQLQHFKESYLERTSFKLEESPSRKSIRSQEAKEIKEVRESKIVKKSSKSKDKDSHVKEAMQQFVQQQRNMLSKIELLMQEKQHLENNTAQIESQLAFTERKLEDYQAQLQKTKFSFEKSHLQLVQRITQLEGELEIGEGRRLQLQNKLQHETNLFSEIQKQLTSKLELYQLREIQHQQQLKQMQISMKSEIQNHHSYELNLYRQMYGEVSKDLQSSRAKELQINKQYEQLKSMHKISEPSFSQSSQKAPLSPAHLKMSSFKINLDSSKVVDIYLDRQQLPKNKEVAEYVYHQDEISSTTSLNQQIEKLRYELDRTQIEKAKQIESEVIAALKNQEADFNEFLKRFEAQKIDYFMSQVLPKKLEEELSKRILPLPPVIENDQLSNHKKQQSLYKQKLTDLQTDSNARIELKLLEFQQNNVPLIISQQKSSWEMEKNKQWEIKRSQIEQFWRKKLQDLQEQSNRKILELNKQCNQSKQLTELEIFGLMRLERNKWIVDTLMAEHLSEWEQKKIDDWAIQEKEIADYWKGTVIPQRQQQWEKQKQRQIASLKDIWRLEMGEEWNKKVNEQIIPQKINEWKEAQIEQDKQVKVNVQITAQMKVQIIQKWKNMNLPHIIEGERNQTIQAFVKLDLPQIIGQQRRNWEANVKLPNIDQILIEEHKKWEEIKNRELTSLSSSFDSRLNEILQVQHSEWERQKIIEIEHILEEQRHHWGESQSNVEEILIKQHQKWEQMKQEEARKTQIQFEVRINEIERTLNSQIIEYQEKYLKEKDRILSAEAAAIDRWRSNELAALLIKEKEIWIRDFNSKELPKIIEEAHRTWQNTAFIRQTQLLQQQKAQHSSMLSSAQSFYQNQLKQQRQQWQAEKQILLTHNKVKTGEKDLIEWERQKNLEWDHRVREIQNYWETIIIPERHQQWMKENEVIIKKKLKEAENSYHQDIQTSFIRSERQKWEKEYQQVIEKQKSLWIEDIPNLLQSNKYSHYLKTFLDSQAAQYQQEIKGIQIQSANNKTKIEQLLAQIANYESVIQQYRNKYLIAEEKVNSLITHEQKSKHLLEQNQRMNKEPAVGNQIMREIEQLRKTNTLLKVELSKLTDVVQQSNNLSNQKELDNSLRKSRLNQIKQFHLNIQSTFERNSPNSRLPSPRRETSELEAIQSLERQIVILLSTIKTKDAQISFLKKTIDAANAELRQNREKLSGQLDNRVQIEKVLGELRNQNLQLEFQIKYLRDKEDNLTNKFLIKQQQIKSLKQKSELDSISIEKVKTSLEYATSYQIKYNQMENLLNEKCRKYQALQSDFERLRFNNQNLSATIQSVKIEKESLHSQIRELEIDRSRIQNSRKEGIQMNSPQEASRLSIQSNRSRTRVDQVKMIREEVTYSQTQRKDLQRLRVFERERQFTPQSKLQNGVRTDDTNEMQALRIINKEVTDISIINNQLSMRCLLLENNIKITTATSETISCFQLIQKHTDTLIYKLLKEDFIPNLQLYHKFIAESRAALSAGKVQAYFLLWESFFANLFHLTIESRVEQMRIQAEELLKLRDEMTEILERQIEASEGDQSLIVEDYKVVLNEIKTLVREFLRSGDGEYLRMLCNSLGVAT